MVDGGFDDLACEGTRLADAQAANRVSGESDLNGALGGFLPEPRIHAALDDAEERLRGESRPRVFSARQPSRALLARPDGDVRANVIPPRHLILVVLEILLAA